jgi:hypothetical protein
MRRCLIFGALVACAPAPVQYRGGVTIKSPELIPVSPDIRVVADADQPVFHAAGSYWLFHDGGWYRGAAIAGPWLLDRAPAWQIRQIDQPFAYTHYVLNKPVEKTETPAQTATIEPTTPAKPQRKNKMFDF